jgi:hypothetical protein
MIIRKLLPKIRKKLLGAGDIFGSASPCREDLLANYTGVLTADELSYRSKVGQDREYFKAGSMKFDGTAYVTESSLLSSDVITNEGVAVATVAAGKIDFTAGSCWDLKVTRGGTLVIWCPGVTGDGTTAANVLSDDGSNGLTVVNMPADFWQEHTDGGGSNYLNEFGWGDPSLENEIWYNPPQIIQDGWTDNGDDTYTNDGTQNGYIRIKSALVIGKTYQADMTIEDYISGSVTLPYDNSAAARIYKNVSGAFSHIFLCTISDLRIYSSLFEGTVSLISVKEVLAAKQPASQADTTKDWLGNTLEYPGAAAIPLEIVKAPVFVGNGVCTAGNASNAGATITSQTGTATATIDAGGTLSFPVGDYEQVTLSNGSKYSFTEGIPAIYDRSGNDNHLTLTNVSATNWQLKARSEYPLLDGYSTKVQAYGGLFGFNGAEGAAENFYMTTADGSDWLLNGDMAQSGTNTLTTTGITEFNIATFDVGITSILFGDTNITGDIGQLADWRPTGNIHFYNTNITGDIGQLADWRPTGDIHFYNTDVSGDVGLLKDWQTTGVMYFFTTDISECSSAALQWRATNINLIGCALDQTGVDNILVSIDAVGLSNGTLNLSGGTNAIPSATGLSAKTSLEGRGWTVTVNS